MGKVLSFKMVPPSHRFFGTGRGVAIRFGTSGPKPQDASSAPSISGAEQPLLDLQNLPVDPALGPMLLNEATLDKQACPDDPVNRPGLPPDSAAESK